MNRNVQQALKAIYSMLIFILLDHEKWIHLKWWLSLCLECNGLDVTALVVWQKKKKKQQQTDNQHKLNLRNVLKSYDTRGVTNVSNDA